MIIEPFKLFAQLIDDSFEKNITISVDVVKYASFTNISTLLMDTPMRKRDVDQLSFIRMFARNVHRLTWNKVFLFADSAGGRTY